MGKKKLHGIRDKGEPQDVHVHNPFHLQWPLASPYARIVPLLVVSRPGAILPTKNTSSFAPSTTPQPHDASPSTRRNLSSTPSRSSGKAAVPGPFLPLTDRGVATRHSLLCPRPCLPPRFVLGGVRSGLRGTECLGKITPERKPWRYLVRTWSSPWRRMRLSRLRTRRDLPALSPTSFLRLLVACCAAKGYQCLNIFVAFFHKEREKEE